MTKLPDRNPAVRFESEKIIGPLLRDMLRKTRAIYLLPRGRPHTELIAVGSGFFLRYLNRTFLVTASHVVRELEHGELYVRTCNEKLESFGGGFFHTGRRSEAETADRVDVAFHEVPPIVSSQLISDHHACAYRS